MNVFQRDFNFSTSAANVADDKCRILKFCAARGFPDAQILKTPAEIDKRGADYTIDFKDGRRFYLDVKRRRAGCRKFWAENSTPEVAVELQVANSSGWTLKDSLADIVAFFFDKADWEKSFFVGKKQLKRAMAKYRNSKWLSRFIRRNSSTGNAGNWYNSTVAFVPVPELKKVCPILEI